jgi:hypothetical protein
MGYLTTFTIYNDSANGITKDPTQFADKIYSLIGTRQFEEFHTTTCVNGLVQQSRHADEKTIYVNAGNCVTEVNPYSKSFKELIKKNPDFARELVEFVEDEVVNLKKVFLEEVLIEKLTDEEKNNIAKKHSTSPETLELLAHDNNYWVRSRVAKNPNTPPETLARLANDDDSNVRYWVSTNPNTPPETLDRLANWKGWKGWDICFYLMENPNTPSETLDRLSYVKDYRYFVAKHSNTAPETLERLANDDDSNVRYWVAKNRHTSKETLNLLLYDNRKDVREAASYRINTKT